MNLCLCPGLICLSNGSILPLSEPELQELAEHVHSEHVKKSNLCRGCLEAAGPRRIRRTIMDIDKATHTLHIDIAGPPVTSDGGFTFFWYVHLGFQVFLCSLTFVS